MIERRGWQTYTSTPPRFYRRIVEEFNAGMIPYDYRHRASVMVHGREVELNMEDINRYFQTELPSHLEDNMVGGVTNNELFVRQNVDLANQLVIEPMAFWVALEYHIKHSNLLTELAFWNLFITQSLRPRTHSSLVPFEVATYLYCLQHEQLLDVEFLIKLEILALGESMRHDRPLLFSMPHHKIL